MDRKNYCYPDLSKAYQISQLYAPLIIGGYVELSNGRKIRLHHIHIEEDAGKLIHQHGDTYVDYNRGGVPLIEIVSEPDIRSIDEAREYVEKLQQVMRYIGISDCKMQEGSMRCDVNISVRPKGSEKLGTRTEIKNMNSINNIAKAMEYEFERQVDLIENGGSVVQETLRYDDATNTTSSMRSKEDAHDYRYFVIPTLLLSKFRKMLLRKSRLQCLSFLPISAEDILMNLQFPKRMHSFLQSTAKSANILTRLARALSHQRQFQTSLSVRFSAERKPRLTRKSLMLRLLRNSLTSL